MTQEDLAEKAGVGLRFIRDLEQGKQSLRLDKVNQVLALFGYRSIPGTERRVDQWEIVMNHLNRSVRVSLKNRNVWDGILVDYKMEDEEIKSWKFVSDKNALKYRASKDESLVQVIDNDDIINVENI